MASVSNAALSLTTFLADGTTASTSVANGSFMVIKVSSSIQVALPGSNGVYLEDGGGVGDLLEGVLTGIGPVVSGDYTGSHTANAGSLGKVLADNGATFNGMAMASGLIGETVAGGTWYEIHFTPAVSSGTVALKLYDAGFSLVGTTNVTITPEPMTLSLLGLGSLALIRRRRHA
jgi:hypothetical protein